MEKVSRVWKNKSGSRDMLNATTVYSGSGFYESRYVVEVRLSVGYKIYSKAIFWTTMEFHGLAEEAFREKVKGGIFEVSKQAMEELDSAGKYSVAVMGNYWTGNSSGVPEF